MHGVPLAPALYVFGDSLLDSGNNNLLPTLAKADFPPYGRDFAKGSTGRFTNGRTVADFIGTNILYVNVFERTLVDEQPVYFNYYSKRFDLLILYI